MFDSAWAPAVPLVRRTQYSSRLTPLSWAVTVPSLSSTEIKLRTEA